MDVYTIKQAYPWQTGDIFELEITSQNLIYTELGKTHAGSQVSNIKNQEIIHKKLIEVAELIKEIDRLNNQ